MLKELVAYTCSKPQVSIFDAKSNSIDFCSFVYRYLQSEDKSSHGKASTDSIFRTVLCLFMQYRQQEGSTRAGVGP